MTQTPVPMTPQHFQYHQAKPIQIQQSYFEPIYGTSGGAIGGKTTLLRTILGRLSPAVGTLLKQSIPGYVPQTSQLAFDYKVRDVLAMGRMHVTGAF